MNATNKKPKSNEQYGISTKLWSTLCHSCDICKFANKKPESRFNCLASAKGELFRR